MSQLYEITNPSDDYGIEGDDIPCAVATLILGQGAYGLHTRDDERRGVLPIMLFGGMEEWIAEHLQGDLGAWIDAHRLELAAVLDTVVIHPEQYRVALGCLPEGSDVEKFRETWHDKHRTSLNDIGARARALAKRLRELDAEAVSA